MGRGLSRLCESRGRGKLPLDASYLRSIVSVHSFVCCRHLCVVGCNVFGEPRVNAGPVRGVVRGLLLASTRHLWKWKCKAPSPLLQYVPENSVVVTHVDLDVAVRIRCLSFYNPGEPFVRFDGEGVLLHMGVRLVYAYLARLVEDLNFASFQRYSRFECTEKCSFTPALAAGHWRDRE